jgi:hypothetical protein
MFNDYSSLVCQSSPSYSKFSNQKFGYSAIALLAFVKADSLHHILYFVC